MRRPSALESRFRQSCRRTIFRAEPCNLLSTSGRRLWRRAADCGNTRLSVRAVQRSQRQASGDFRLDPRIRLHRVPLTQQLNVVFVQVLLEISGGAQRAEGSGLDSPKRARLVCNTRRNRLFVPILVRPSTEAEPASFNVTGSIKSRFVAPLLRRRFDKKDLLILVAEIQAIFQKCGQRAR